ncbi:hypothetical protein FA95DRAFT_1679095 [Auriscalpium vulgare]|uniref:Uncharacterized protein n=1 Tax=Auriscalpium vulgare TaxID=40419 RepID=A0ACB8RV51_9AGAM|nr:hypothetical protein FA95DRAFT_1679095 [Auriscalpium vulgare]
MSKRPHTPPRSSTPLSDDSTTRTPKAVRTANRSPQLYCNLPPTCHAPHPPTPLADIRALEAHYASYHAHVCEEKGCGCVFPDARLLELHQTECHNPVAEVRKERGEKIFACHLSSCGRYFSSPKKRRLHLISAHEYPKEYFFGVTNKGVGGLLRKWGEGASLLKMDQEPAQSPVSSTGAASEGNNAVDALASSMTALALVPSSVRFGRGGKSGGLAAPRGRPHTNHTNLIHTPNHNTKSKPKHNQNGHAATPSISSTSTDAMDEDSRPVQPQELRGGGRGRGRGRGGGGGGGGGAGRGFVLPPPRGGFLTMGAGRPYGAGVGRGFRGRGRGRGMT